jgi:hypothetical protein
MRYIIVHEGDVWTTEWFLPENDYVEGMIVIDTHTNQYRDNVGWFDIEEDHL